MVFAEFTGNKVNRSCWAWPEYRISSTTAHPSNNIPPSNIRTVKGPFELMRAHLLINEHAAHAHSSHSHGREAEELQPEAQAGSAGIRQRPFRFEQRQKISPKYPVEVNFDANGTPYSRTQNYALLF